jgi:hypothetical protein
MVHVFFLSTLSVWDLKSMTRARSFVSCTSGIFDEGDGKNPLFRTRGGGGENERKRWKAFVGPKRLPPLLNQFVGPKAAAFTYQAERLRRRPE